jgi:hypothetical protein
MKIDDPKSILGCSQFCARAHYAHFGSDLYELARAIELIREGLYLFQS